MRWQIQFASEDHLARKYCNWVSSPDTGHQYAEYGNAARKVFLKIQKSAPALVRHLTCNRKAAPGLFTH